MMLSDPCRSFSVSCVGGNKRQGEGPEMDMAKLCGEDFGWARSDFVLFAKQTPQCPFAECVDWYCTLTLRGL